MERGSELEEERTGYFGIREKYKLFFFWGGGHEWKGRERERKENRE